MKGFAGEKAHEVIDWVQYPSHNAQPWLDSSEVRDRTSRMTTSLYLSLYPPQHEYQYVYQCMSKATMGYDYTPAGAICRYQVLHSRTYERGHILVLADTVLEQYVVASSPQPGTPGTSGRPQKVYGSFTDADEVVAIITLVRA